MLIIYEFFEPVLVASCSDKDVYRLQLLEHRDRILIRARKIAENDY
jgi:hypothetical protein